MKRPSLTTLGIIAAIGATCLYAGGCTRHEPGLAEKRSEMVRTQLVQRGIRDGAILNAFRTVPREEFVLEKYKKHAYDDIETPLGFRQSLDRPYENAIMMMALDIGPSDRVLEVGTGSGYLSSLMSRIAKQVYTIEIDPGIADLARANITRIGYKNIKSKTGDGFLGWPEHAPFNVIVLTCSAETVPKPLIDQLADGGRLLMPIGGTKKFQELILFRKEDGKLVESRRIAPTTFVPMKGKIQNDH